MIRTLAILILATGIGAHYPVQDPKTQIILKATLYTTSSDLWADVREVDAGFKAIGAEVARLAKGLEAESLEDRNKTSAAITSLGVSAYGAIKEARDKAGSEPIRFELDAILKNLAGEWPATLAMPAGITLGKAEAEALRKRLTDKGVRLMQAPFLSMKDGNPASIFVGDEMPLGAGKRRVRLDGDGKKLRLEEQPPVRTVKFGFQMLIKPVVSPKDRKSVTLEIAVTNSHIRKPVREVESPLGRVSDPEVVEIGVDLSPVLESGQGYMAGPFPSDEEKGTPFWILIEAQIIK